MAVQLARYRLNFDRGDGPPFQFTIFQVQNQLLDRSCGLLQHLAGVFVLCIGHPLMIPF